MVYDIKNSLWRINFHRLFFLDKIIPQAMYSNFVENYIPLFTFHKLKSCVSIC